MAEKYQILLIEKDKQVVEEVTRYLHASSAGVGFSVDCQDDLVQGRSTVARSRPDAVIIDAGLVDQSGPFDEFKKALDELGIPVLILSATNGQALQNKAEMAGAADYLLKNKLSYFYLPRAILSAIQLYNSSASSPRTDNAVHTRLLDGVKEAVMIADRAGDVVYSNIAAKQLLNDRDAVDLLRKVIHLKDDRKEFKATISIENATYDLTISPQDWAGEACTCIYLSKNTAQPGLALESKVKILNEFIESCSIPFVLLVDGLVRKPNDSFCHILTAERNTLIGRPLSDFISVTGGGTINLLQTPGPEMIVSVMGAHVSAPLELLRRTVAVGEQQITICSIVPPEQTGDKLLSPHRLMEIASHELREPIRTSVSYLHLLTEGLKKQDGDTKMLSYAETISAEVSRAEQMLADMKTLLNISDKAIKPVQVNTSVLVQDVIRQLKPAIDASGAVVDVSAMPTIRADSNDMKRLLYHLIDNALKFRKADKRPYIEVLCARDGTDWRCCVRDNGIGIDSKYHTLIFEPFRRLNRVDLYTGSGNGLCICRHIVEAHGGRIWVESHEGFGSSFFFTLPGE